MIPIELSLAVCLAVSIPALLVFLHWIFYNPRGEQFAATETKYLIECPICTAAFMNHRADPLIQCPHCHSLITNETLAITENEEAPK